jgi:hypothetical protein
MAPRSRFCLLALVVVIVSFNQLSAQAYPTASRSVDMTVFGGITGIYTGLSDGNNRAATAGLDLNLPEIAMRFRPSLEVRATSPIDRGKTDNQRSLLAGPRVEFEFARIHPYADFLAGRGKMNFSRLYLDYNGRPVASQPRSNVFSSGAGLRVDLVRNLAAFGDVQFQHWDTNASLSGHLFAKPFTAGLVYRFTAFGRYPKR